ncbi:hypothetical protein RQP46_011268 [Phenoliferia psychrophenolica]
MLPHRVVRGALTPLRQIRTIRTSARTLSAAPPPLRPTFTTPAPLPTSSSDPLDDPTKPLPPTDLPIEDYASPLMHTASSIGTFFRYAVYSSVGLVGLTLGAFAGVHLWVEHVELARPPQLVGDPHHWDEELEGWSGGHRGGGTDPRLGLRARMAVRSAWIGQSWGGGIAVSPTSGSPPSSSSNTNNGGGGGGTMIGSAPRSTAPGESGREVGDAGWQMAEGYLVYALTRAAQKGIALGFTSTSSSPSTSIDRAAVELESRLAGVRERIGGRYKLEEARAGWERVYYALSASPSSTDDGWTHRERIRATRRLGEIAARLAGLEPEGSHDRQVEQDRAIGWFMGGLLPALTDAVGSTAALEDVTTKHAGPKASFFAFWSRSHPSPSSPISEISKLALLVNQAASLPSIDPATARTILTSLSSLETLLARSRLLPSASEIQRASLTLSNALHLSPPFLSPPPLLSSLSLSPPPPSLPWSSPQWVSPTLAQLVLLTRTSILTTHLSEVLLASPSLSSSSRPEPEALQRLQGAINDCDVIVSALSASPLLAPTTGLARAWFPSSERRDLQIVARNVVRDAKLTGAMAARLTAFVHERGCGSLSKGKKGRKGMGKGMEWCGGDASAEAFYAKAMEFSREQEGGDGGSGFKEAERGFRRAQKAVLEAEKGVAK